MTQPLPPQQLPFSLYSPAPLLRSVSVEEVWVGAHPCFRILETLLQTPSPYVEKRGIGGVTRNGASVLSLCKVSCPPFFPTTS